MSTKEGQKKRLKPSEISQNSRDEVHNVHQTNKSELEGFAVLV
jgi:hypothetical protein